MTMKKNILPLALLLGLSMSMTARDRSVAEMRQAAAGALTNRMGANASAVNPQSLQILSKQSNLTVLGNGSGFAVIANDDTFDAVLGYTDSPFSTTCNVPAFQWWMEAMDQSLQAAMDNGTGNVTVSRAPGYRTSVEPLISALWGQDTPFNNMTPVYVENGKETHYVTGCVATAMSMILAYHKYPTSGEGSRSYVFTPGDGTSSAQTLKADFENTVYDYDNMLDVYTEGQYNDTQANAVATLMSHCGISVKMTYTKDGSGAYTADACRALRKYWRMNSDIKFFSRTFFPVDEWVNKLYCELNDDCPILYGGQSQSGGHEFILDGYDEEGLFHVNWGWRGEGNGYFDIAKLNGYSSGQEFVEMRTAEDTRYKGGYYSVWGLKDNVKMAKSGSTQIKVNCTAIYNMDVDDFSGDIIIMAMNQETGALKRVGTVASINRIATYNGTTVSDALASIGTLSDGTYRLYLASLSKDETDAQPIRSSEGVCNSYILTVENGATASLKIDKSGNWTGIESVVAADDSDNSYNTVRVYDCSGREVYSADKSAFRLSDVPASGVLVIKKGANAIKVVK